MSNFYKLKNLKTFNKKMGKEEKNVNKQNEEIRESGEISFEKENEEIEDVLESNGDTGDIPLDYSFLKSGAALILSFVNVVIICFQN